MSAAIMLRLALAIFSKHYNLSRIAVSVKINFVIFIVEGRLFWNAA
jgi:hypothetical protein